jgi:hypothetical protein
MTEAQYQAKIIKRYEADGWMVVKLMRCNINGMPDLMLLGQGGQVHFIECKAARGRLSPVQQLRHDQLRARNFTVDVIKP